MAVLGSLAGVLVLGFGVHPSRPFISALLVLIRPWLVWRLRCYYRALVCANTFYFAGYFLLRPLFMRRYRRL